jgi:pimeloyl-ACP methyl ester carboxylesterase
MSSDTSVLWLSASPALQRFNRPLMKTLVRSHEVREWAFSQCPDEALSLDAAVDLLHDYLGQQRDAPVHLIGHSTSGLIGLLYAWQYPQYVRSLTLLSVGVNLTLDWQAHYYAQVQFLRCSRSMLLSQIVYNLFGLQSRGTTLALVGLLEQDLLTSPSPHTLASHYAIPTAEVPVPVMICGGESDIILDPSQFEGWRAWLHTHPSNQHPSDRIWLCPNGGHFFHSEHPHATSVQVQDFWTEVETASKFSSSTPSLAPGVSDSVVSDSVLMNS